uniref:Uncharacterized protein n=1 Tax=uncultured marine group II/III euryarchaeote KM3_27_D02 TaxID=1456428 RepID=A0A075GW97_9EURY|nr:hypothetical protein [uncultured marine group II/III euryarchaeote KM3_27_D02]
MESRRLIPVTLIALVAILLIIQLISESGGISQEAFAIAFLFCIGAFTTLLVTQKDLKLDGKSSAIGGSSSAAPDDNFNSKDERTDRIEAKSELPDPLDEGFDAPFS